jgi:hypothetical protein
MDWLDSTITFLAGPALRLGIPIAVTLLAAYILHKVDIRWQKEAAQQAPKPVEKLKCWEVNNCTTEQKGICLSPNSAEPCWQEHRQANGYLREECLNCKIFHQAPIPTLDYPKP